MHEGDHDCAECRHDRHEHCTTAATSAAATATGATYCLCWAHGHYGVLSEQERDDYVDPADEARYQDAVDRAIYDPDGP